MAQWIKCLIRTGVQMPKTYVKGLGGRCGQLPINLALGRQRWDPQNKSG